jgi:DNA-binding response OmpR family regulator
MLTRKCCLLPGRQRAYPSKDGENSAVASAFHEGMMPLPTILLVDDDLDLREVVAAILAAPGYTVLAASDGYEALRILVDRDVDLLITDVQMPGISGFELARQAKLMRPRLHVIYISGRTSKPDRLGPIYGVLVRKPVRGRELLTIVEREMRQGAGSGPASGR